MADAKNPLITCIECKEKKEVYRFKQIDMTTKTGLCGQCGYKHKFVTQKMHRTNQAIDKAQELMSGTIRDIERIFKRHKIPTEARLVSDIMIGATTILKNVQTLARQAKMTDEDKVAIGDIIEISYAMKKYIMWPTLLYAYVTTDYNQVKTAKVLGISRNNLRTQMEEIKKECPRLISEYECQDNWLGHRDRNEYLKEEVEVLSLENNPRVRIVEEDL